MYERTKFLFTSCVRITVQVQYDSIRNETERTSIQLHHVNIHSNFSFTDTKGSLARMCDPPNKKQFRGGHPARQTHTAIAVACRKETSTKLLQLINVPVGDIFR
jgi:hypothetical protein